LENSENTESNVPQSETETQPEASATENEAVDASATENVEEEEYKEQTKVEPKSDEKKDGLVKPPSNAPDTIVETKDKPDTIVETKDKESAKETASAPVPPSLPKEYTFKLSTPLGAEITSREQTFVEINGVLYLKVTPPSNQEEVVLPGWYTSLKKDYQTASRPPTKAQLLKKELREKKFSSQKAEKTNGSLVYVVDVPEFLQNPETVSDKKDKKKKFKTQKQEKYV